MTDLHRAWCKDRLAAFIRLATGIDTRSIYPDTWEFGTLCNFWKNGHVAIVRYSDTPEPQLGIAIVYTRAEMLALVEYNADKRNWCSVWFGQQWLQTHYPVSE